MNEISQSVGGSSQDYMSPGSTQAVGLQNGDESAVHGEFIERDEVTESYFEQDDFVVVGELQWPLLSSIHSLETEMNDFVEVDRAVATSPLSEKDRYIEIDKNGDEVNPVRQPSNYIEMKSCATGVNTNANADQFERTSKGIQTTALWQAKQAARISKLDEEERTGCERIKQVASKALADWDAAYNRRVTITATGNRKREVQAQSHHDNMNARNVWADVANYIDFDRKPLKSGKDTSKLKGILLNLKATGVCHMHRPRE